MINSVIFIMLNSILVSGTCHKTQKLVNYVISSRVICVVLFFSSFTFPTGSSLRDKVYQSSADMFSSPGGTVNISCVHNIPNYDMIYWYKKSKRELQLLGYMNFNTDYYPQDGLGVTIGGSAREGQTCTLTVKGLTVNSSAVYFCAASLHTDEYHCSSVQKPHHDSLQLGTSHGRGVGSMFSLRVDLSQNVSLSFSLL